MNCTAWNSVRANALTNSPSAIPRIAFATASSHDEPTLDAADVEPEQPEADDETTTACTAATAAKASAVADEQVELRERHRHQPLERPVVRSRSIVIEVTRNIDDEREEPEQRRADALEDRGLAVEHVPDSAMSSAGTTSSSATVRGSRRSWEHAQRGGDGVTRRSRAPPPRSARGRPSSRSSVARALAAARPACAARACRPSRRSSSSSQRSASSITWLETSSVVAASASGGRSAHRSRRSTGSRPTVGSSRTSSSGSPSSAVASETRARWPPDSRADDWPVVARRAPTVVDHLVDAVAGGAEHAREVAQVLAHGEVGVDRRRLRHVADPAAQRRRARRLPSTVTVAGLDDLDADDRAHQRRLAAAARPEQPGRPIPAPRSTESPGSTESPPRRRGGPGSRSSPP